MKKHINLLIDGDMFAFRACSSCELEVNWGQIWTLHVDLEEAKARFVELLDNAIERALRSASEYIKFDSYSVNFAFTGKNNFRKLLNPSYKANRIGKRKPVAYDALVSWIKGLAYCVEIDSLEADDLIGITATNPVFVDNCIIISGDKDMNCIYGYHYDYIRDTFTHVTPEEAYRNFLTQTLVGDTTDGYSGCPKVGKVTAERLLDKDCSWATVVTAYEKAGLSEDVAIEQARMARILLFDDWDAKHGEVILWKPTEQS